MSIRNGIVAYKSPIETIWSDIEHECAEHFEQMVLIAVQNVGIRVNKEELVKALAYDRDQYRKGWEDRDSEIVRCKDCMYYDESIEGVAGFHRCSFRLRLEPTGGFCHYAIRRQITAESE